MTDLAEPASYELGPQDLFWDQLWPEARDEECVELARRIRALRRRSGMTQEAVAKVLKLTSQAVSQMETGQRRIEVLTLRKFAQIYDVSLDQLLGMGATSKTDPAHSTHAHLGCPSCGANLQLSAHVRSAQ